MKDTLLRSALLLFVGVALSACGDDDPTDLDTLGTPSEVSVRAYVEVNGNDTFDAGIDQPLTGTTITLESTLTDNVLTAETGADGLATFSDVPSGVYNAVIDTTDLPDGLTSVSIIEPGLEQSVVAPFAGDSDGVEASFEFRYLPAVIEGTVFTDVNRSGAYEADIDVTPAPGVELRLYAGEGVSGDPVQTAETDDLGQFSFTVYPSTYTLDVVADGQTEVVLGDVFEMTLAAGETIDLTALVRTAVLTIAEAEAQEDSTVVLVDGVVSVEPGMISTDYFWIQDATGGVKVFVGDPTSYVLGDSLRVTGEIVTRFGEKQIEAISIEDLGTGAIPQPIELDGNEFLSAVHQGELVTLDSVLVDSIGAGTSYNVWVIDSSGDTIIVRVDSDAGIGRGAFTVGQRYTVSGVSSPFGGREQLYPRFPGDIIPLDATVLPIASARSVPDSTDVTVRGVVHTGTGNISTAYFFMHDNTGGTKVFLATGTSGQVWTAGDSIQVTGEKVTRFGEVQIEATAIADLGTGTVRAPIVVTGAELLTGLTQGNLVTVQTVTVDAVGTGSSYNVLVTDPESATQFTIRVDSDAGITPGTFVVGRSYTVTGAVSPFGGAQQLYPRSNADIVAH